jgi:hypothetical protein
MKRSTHKECAYGIAGKSFMAQPKVVQNRKQGHLERPPSQELAVGLKGRETGR